MNCIKLKIVLIIFFILIAGGCYRLRTVKESEILVTLPQPKVNREPESAEADFIPETQASLYYVYICGAVEQEGVYQVPEGSRIFQVVELAGGYQESAAKEYLNMAAEVSDGMRLFVPTVEELKEQGAAMWADSTDETSKTAGGKVNINTASKEQLMSLTGIGAARADTIIKYREEHGKFNRIEDLMNISGIKQAAFDKIKEQITV